MKKILIILSALSISSIDAYDERINNFYGFISTKNVTSHTFMFTRPIYYHLNMRKHLWHNFVHNPQGCQGISAQVIGFYQTSQSKSGNTEYFFPCENTCLLVAGDNITDDLCKRNVRAEWLYLSSDFEGLMSIKPEQRQAGFSVEMYVDFKKYTDWKFLQSSWATIELPFMWVENNINLRQKILQAAPQAPDLPQNICEAFNQPALRFAKLNGKMHEKKLAEVRLSFGTNYLSSNHYEIDYYSTLLCPTGNQQNPTYTFSPVVGDNKHWGIGAGTDFQILLNRDTSCFYNSFFLDFEVLYLFHNHQCRTFDLKCKPWSRYLLLVDKCKPGVTVPAADVFTLKSAVTPYCYVDLSLGWRFERDWFEFEFGYNVWGHSNEKVTLHQGFDRCWGIAGRGTIEDECDGIVPATASRSTIACQAANDEVFVPIRETDLELRSGEAHSSLNHTVHVALGGTQRTENYGFFFGAGLFAEWPEKNSALQLIGTWAKIGASF